ncbi:MAG: phosphonate ABC transporter ATP-binding protein [Betaproteobacteria bacterium]
MTEDHQRAVRVERVSKTFRVGGQERRALDDISFSVAQGERIALRGASGSGKSTLLRCICGLELVDFGSGPISTFGETLQDGVGLSPEIRKLRRRISIIFQQFNLVGRLPLLTNVLTGLAADLPLWRAVSGRYPIEAQAKALDALDAVGLTEQAFQRASTLSGGQQQRAAVARALVQGAQLLLADEPVASLDPESTRRVMDLLLALNREYQLTLMISLHHVALARRYCDRVIALRDGRLVFDGPTSALTAPFLRSLYGTSADELIDDEMPPPSPTGDVTSDPIGHSPVGPS